jgi:hypothetical protein
MPFGAKVTSPGTIAGHVPVADGSVGAFVAGVPGGGFTGCTDGGAPGASGGFGAGAPGSVAGVEDGEDEEHAATTKSSGSVRIAAYTSVSRGSVP